MNQAWSVWLGRMAYRPAWELQRRVAAAVQQGSLPDTVLWVEHEPVYTVGRAARGSLGNLLWDRERLGREGIELYEVDRGGDITYHGPGQLVGYPIVDLNRRGRDLHRYLRDLEESLIRALAAGYGIAARRLPPHTGVWVGEEKIAAIGVKAAHWVTQHGFALNVCPDLRHFAGIVPCGIRDKGVTSLERLGVTRGDGHDLERAGVAVGRAVAEVFDWEWLSCDPQTLEMALPLERVGSA